MLWLESVHLISLGLVEGDGRLYDVPIKVTRKRKTALRIRNVTLGYSTYYKQLMLLHRPRPLVGHFLRLVEKKKCTARYYKEHINTQTLFLHVTLFVLLSFYP